MLDQYRIRNKEPFRNLTDEQANTIEKVATIKSYKKGQILFEEGKKSRNLYFLLSGELELYKTHGDSDFQLNRVPPLNLVGELSFIDGSTRSATAKAAEDIEIMEFSYETLKKEYPDLLEALSLSCYRLVMKRLRDSNHSHVHDLEAKLGQVKLQNEFGYFFIAVIVMLAVGAIMDQILSTYMTDVGYAKIALGWVYLFMISLPIVSLIYFFKYKVSDFGVTKKNLIPSLIESLIIGVILVVMMGSLYGVLKTFIHDLAKPRYVYDSNSLVFHLDLITYFFHSFLQEFLARGMLQTSIQKFLLDKRGIKSVFVASLMFAAAHFHVSAILGVVTFGVSVLLGFIFIRQKNIWGISLIHFFIGVPALVFGFF